MKKFLLVNPFGVGDALFTTPVIRAIKDNYPDSFIGYWCNERVAEIFKHDPNIAKVFALNRGDLKRAYQNSWLDGTQKLLNLFFSVKKERFDLLLDFSLDHRYSLFAKLLGIKRRIGFDYKGRGRFLTDKININGYNNKHAVEYYLSLLEFLGIEPRNKKLYLAFPDSYRAKASIILKRWNISGKDLVVGIAPGAGGSWGKDASLKHWPNLRFAQLADRLIEERQAKVIILGDESERPLADVIINAMKNKAVDLVGKTSLSELIAVIKNLKLLITNDGGPLHIAVALGTRTVSLFGPVDHKVYGPYPADILNHIVLKKDIDCSPCYQNFRLKPCVNDRACLKDIEVEEVFAAAQRLIKKE